MDLLQFLVFCAIANRQISAISHHPHHQKDLPSLQVTDHINHIMTTRETIQEEVVHCNRVIEPEEFVFSSDDKDGLELSIHYLALLVHDKVAPHTESAQTWNKYARACVRKGNRNATRSFVLAFRFGADADETTNPCDCTCWCLQLPTGEEIVLSILPRQNEEDSDRAKKEIQRMLRMHKLHRGFAAWVDIVDNIELVSVSVITNPDLPIRAINDDAISSPPQIKRELLPSQKKRKIVLFPPQKKTLVPNPNFVLNPRNPYTRDQKQSPQKQNQEKGSTNPVLCTPDNTRSPRQPIALFQSSPQKQEENKHCTKAVPCTPDDTESPQQRTPSSEPSEDQKQSPQKQVLNKEFANPVTCKPADTQVAQNATASSQQQDEKEEKSAQNATASSRQRDEKEEKSERQTGCVCKIINY
jgi:hypothetical protein